MRRGLSHVGPTGEARMVDVSGKAATGREAEAAGRIVLSRAAFEAVRDGGVAKGDVLAVARIAGIQAAKRTAEWIPLCHVVPLDDVRLDLTLDPDVPGIEVRALSRARGPTGVEMEALVAVAAALLALYDMVKALDRSAIIGPIGVVRKSGGRSGAWHRGWPPPVAGSRGRATGRVRTGRG